MDTTTRIDQTSRARRGAFATPGAEARQLRAELDQARRQLAALLDATPTAEAELRERLAASAAASAAARATADASAAAGDAYQEGRRSGEADGYRRGRDDERAAQLAERGQVWIPPAATPAPGGPRTSCPVCHLARGPAGVCCGIPGPDRADALAQLAAAPAARLLAERDQAREVARILAERLAEVAR